MAQFLRIAVGKQLFPFPNMKTNVLQRQKPILKLPGVQGLLEEQKILVAITDKGYPKIISHFTIHFANNQGPVKLIENLVYNWKLKHIPFKHHKTQELVSEGDVYFELICTDNIVADELSKLVCVGKFREFVEMLRMVDL